MPVKSIDIDQLNKKGYTRAMIYFGTSGFSYNDWVENFCPIGMRKQEDNDFTRKPFYEILKLIIGGDNQLVLAGSCG